jgi:hypothetical protein
VTSATVGRTVVSSTDPSTKKSKKRVHVLPRHIRAHLLARLLVCQRLELKLAPQDLTQDRDAFGRAQRFGTRDPMGATLGFVGEQRDAASAAMSRGSFVATATSANGSLIVEPDWICGSQRTALDMKLSDLGGLRGVARGGCGFTPPFPPR